MAVRGPRGRLRHRRGRGALASRDVPPPDLRKARARILLSMAALCAGGRRPAREIATRELRSECSISRPALALPPPTGTAATFTYPCRHPPVPQPPSPRQTSRRPPVGRPVLPGPATTHQHRSRIPRMPRTTLQSGGSYYLALPPPTGTAATPPIPQPHQPRWQIHHRIRTTPSGLDNRRINKPSTTCAQPQDLTKARQRGDVETNNTTARPQQRTGETGVTSAPGKCTKNTHFSPAKAMAVATPHRHTRAKATVVSDNRAASLTGTGSATHSH